MLGLDMLAVLVVLVTGSDGRWHPGIGDPTPVGWLTVVAYAVAALLAGLAARASLRQSRALPHDAGGEWKKQRLLVVFWLCTALFMLALGLNKQLDLQTLFTEIGRDWSREQGWYERRRRVQFAFIVLLTACGAAFTFALAYFLRSMLRRVIGAVLGIGWISVFVVVRAASFHYVDILLRMGPGPIRLNWVLELGGISCIALSAFLYTRRSARRLALARAPGRARAERP